MEGSDKKNGTEGRKKESFTIKRKGEAGRWNLGKLFKLRGVEKGGNGG